MFTNDKQGEVTHKEDSAQLSKRKKQTENMTGQQKQPKRPKFDWTQSNEDLTVRLKMIGMKENQVKDLDVQFADNDVTVKLPDGRSWMWILSGEIYRERSRVSVKKQNKNINVTLHMKKKVPNHWERLEAEPPSEKIEIQTVESELIENQEPVASSLTELNEDDGSQLPGASTGVTDLSNDPQAPDLDPQDVNCDPQGLNLGSELLEDDQKAETGSSELETEEVFVKEEEPVVELQHIKHDYIDKDDAMIVHIYVRGVNKDNLVINFEEDSLRVKFQTGHKQFLNLHSGCTDETKFSWHIKLRDMAVKEKCKFKVTTTLIEVTIAKKVFKKWGDLEELKRKATPVISKSDSWVPVSGVEARSWSDPPLDNEAPSRAATRLNEMKQNIEKENLNQKARDAASGASTSKDFLQKPTAKVQPLNKQEESRQAVTPGFTGLDNLGNTCFMNGVLQCLVNTREFRDFFLSGDFQHDLNTDNVLGSGGKLAVSFAVLCRLLWSGKYFSYAPSKLKNLVAQKASQFTGFAQHDSQEFMAFLLDGLHEDVNRVQKKPYTETVEDEGRPDELVADEAWAVHKKRNNSFIVDLFQGQYKSKLVCPVCQKVSITFDPFLYLSLPLPKRQRLLPVTVMWKDPYRKPVRYMLRLSKEATVEALKDALQKKTGIHPSNMRVFEACKGTIYKIFSRGASLRDVQANETIIACEVLSKELAGETVHEVAVIQRTLMPNKFPTRCSSCKKLCPEGSKLKRCTKCLKVGYCDQACQKTHWQYHKQHCENTPDPVGTPFIISVPESRATFSKICQLMEAYARYSVELFQPPVKAEQPQTLSSHPSSSNLSNSSQSSGSLNSLDSQSSFSSSCTITAEQEQKLDEMDNPVDVDQRKTVKADNSQALPVDCDPLPVSQTGSNGAKGENGANSEKESKENKLQVPSLENVISTGSQIQDDAKSSNSDSGYTSLADTQSMSETRITSDQNQGPADPGSDSGADKEFSSPIRPVLGIQTGDLERSLPMFFIKPLDSKGDPIVGGKGANLEDKGDLPVDLTDKFYLSMDWKNNDKFPGYVLVQTKDMEVENDSSMMSASLEESNITLDQCMDMFTEPEVLNPEEAWYCPRCKEHREATKQLSTWRLPHTLIIQLKRFSFRNFIWRDKIDKMVEFPTRGLDLSHYYIGARPSDEPPPIYDLYGVVNHHGGILGGHYTSYVRCADIKDGLKNEVGWRLCDDSRVSSVSHEKNVVTRAAYLLFYRRRQVFVAPPSSCLTSELTDRPPDERSDDDDDDDEYESAQSDNDEIIENEKDRESKGRLIDTSTFELPDSVESKKREVTLDSDGRTVGDVPLEEINAEADLGYTDMDSVD